ncbi:MAG: acylneuraminate cytidylyltransferase family protein [Rhodospirillales bacterium]|jgi:N-acylneuraminate cytidylyltransferase|nr:acylneuraminate cytidylyltransferase family protein [Rhodospirillales bacterium]
MIEGKRVLAVITARGGSKGLPGKNLSDAGGKPLIAWSIEAAQGSRFIDRTVLSSDDAGIMATATLWGCEAPFVRPPELATDEAPIEGALLHALDEIGEVFDYVVLLQPTSPLRQAADIDGAIETCHASGAPACISVSAPAKSPYWMFTLDDEGRMRRLIETAGPTHRRQDLPEVVAANGAVYVMAVPDFRQSGQIYSAEAVAHVMAPERSLDVDSAMDLALVDALLKKGE